MITKRACLPIMVMCLMAALVACEKAEETLTPPAVMEKTAHKVTNTEKPKTQIPVETGLVSDDVNEPLSALPDDLEIPNDEMTDGTDESVSPDTSTIKTATLFPAEVLGNASAHICFFSFNTSTEYVQLKRMVKQLNAASKVNLTITEYQVLDSDPFDNFVALMKSGKRCDGIVLSGHHTDEFYGERSDGDLEIEDLEELACDPLYASWFGNIKALWLQGCNTVKADVNNTDLDEDELITGSPIQFMQRLLDPTDMEESVEDMRDLLYENTNEENLVNDYMRVFSGATVYGWSFVAPGEEAGAQKSIPYHLAQATRLVDKGPQYFQNPLQTEIPPVAAERYSQVLYGLLTRPNRPDGHFPAILSEKTFMQAWRDHGNYRYQYTFDNHDIEAFPALGNSNNEILKQVKGLTCLMHQLDDRLDDMSMLEVADYILRDRSLTTYNSYLLWAMLRSLPKDSTEHAQLQQRLLTDDYLVKELRFNARNGGYSQKDAEEFLAALGTTGTVVAEPAPAVIPATEKPVREEAPIAARSAAGKPAPEVKTANATDDASPSVEAVSAPAPVPSGNKESGTEPWYMNEGMDGTPADEGQVFEFKNDSPG